MFAGGGGEGGAAAGGLFFRPGRFVFQPKYWANLFKCVFFVLFFCLLFFALPWGSVGRFFFLIFFIRAFSPLPFSRKLLKKFLRGDFPQPLHFKKCSAVPEKQLIFNYRKLSLEGAVSRQSSSFCQEPIRATFEQLSLQKAAFDVFLSKIEQHFDKLRETFWKISSNLWKALSMVVHASTVVNANVSSTWLGICQILFFSLLYYTETLSSLIYKTQSNTVNFRLCALPPPSLISPPPVIGPSKGEQKNASAYKPPPLDISLPLAWVERNLIFYDNFSKLK